MKISITLNKAEAQKILGDAIAREWGGAAGRCTVDSVEWRAYGDTVEIELIDDPHAAKSPSAA